MSARTAAWLAWSLWALTVALTALAFLFSGLAWTAGAPGAGVRPVDAAFTGALLACATVGAAIVSRRPTNAIGWLFCGLGLALGVVGFARPYAIYSLLAAPGTLPAGAALAWLHTVIVAPVSAGLTTSVLLLFPHGRLPSTRWRPVAWLSASGIALLAVGLALKPGPLEAGDLAFVHNPLGIEGAGGLLGGLDVVGLGLVVAGALGSAAAMVTRLRAARGVERLQLKWIAAAAVLLGLASLATGFVYLGLGAQAAANLGAPFIGLAFAGVPIAAGIAILRYRLYEIDLIIRRTLIYGTLTAALVTLYLGGVVLLQAAFRAVTGQTSELAIIISTLAIAALFQPLRHWLQGVIDRAFYRRKYDAARTLAAFSAHLRDEVDLPTLREELVAVVQETMQPACVSLWVRPAYLTPLVDVQAETDQAAPDPPTDGV